ncbi:MAG: ISKra4 family transposase [Deltaproteobacteria bacterium]|nr:ISKra4 family transposase [Deltaproteobacteria bacterium]
MTIKIQLVFAGDHDTPMAAEEVTLLEKNDDCLENLGLTLEESKEMLGNLQRRIVEKQTATYAELHRACEHCGRPCRRKGFAAVTFRTLFGNVDLKSPRFYHCRCQEQESKTFSPLTGLLSEHTAPELLFMETKWASLVSYAMAVRMLKDVLPVNEKLSSATARNHLLKVAERDEAELGEEQYFFIDGCPRDWGELPRPSGPITVGIDGGYVHDREDRRNHFEVIVGKSVPRDGPAKYFGLVQSHDAKPRRRLFEVLTSQGMQMNQQVTFLSDGADNLRDLQLYMNPQSEHLLDWFHITMRLTVLKQYAKGVVKVDKDAGTALQETLERLKWYLWHGNVCEALYEIEGLECCAEELVDTYPKGRKLGQVVREFQTYIERNGQFIPNYGERWRHGEAISTAFVESSVNAVVNKRFCKKQQMQWSKRGAHLLLQTRTRVLNGELRSRFQRWYPNFNVEEQESQKAA